MKKVLKWIGILLLGLVGLVVLAAALVYFLSGTRLGKTYDFSVEMVAIPEDAQSVADGEHIALSRGCTDCHGGDLGGATFIEDPALARLYASNLTPGEGGIGRIYSDQDYVRAIRHGVGPDGKPLLYMPSQEFYYLSDGDLGALVAYLKQLPPVDRTLPEDSVGPMGRVLFLAGQLPLMPAELIDHAGPRPQAPEVGVTAEYGQYLAAGCIGCHGPSLAGGPIPGAPPDAPPSANLTPGGELSNWTETDFITTLRTGVTPDGHSIDVDWMPWPVVAQMTDDELGAIWLFLQSLPAEGN